MFRVTGSCPDRMTDPLSCGLWNLRHQVQDNLKSIPSISHIFRHTKISMLVWLQALGLWWKTTMAIHLDVVNFSSLLYNLNIIYRISRASLGYPDRPFWPRCWSPSLSSTCSQCGRMYGPALGRFTWWRWWSLPQTSSTRRQSCHCNDLVSIMPKIF